MRRERWCLRPALNVQSQNDDVFKIRGSRNITTEIATSRASACRNTREHPPNTRDSGRQDDGGYEGTDVSHNQLDAREQFMTHQSTQARTQGGVKYCSPRAPIRRSEHNIRASPTQGMESGIQEGRPSSNGASRAEAEWWRTVLRAGSVLRWANHRPIHGRQLNCPA